MCACARMNGCSAAAWCHRASSVGEGSPKNPPTSAPMKGMPAIECASSIGMDAARCDHCAALSPVHTAAVRCEPAKKARVKTKDRRPGVSRARSASAVAL
eukprot:Amastigsp_a678267_45.p7 type:complete len:100 gc:universal Amastigsp_a678267_45:2015-1716(-)